MNADGSLLFRLNGVLRNSNGQTDFSRDDRNFIAPSLTRTPSPRTKVTPMAEATRDRMTPKSIWPGRRPHLAQPQRQHSARALHRRARLRPLQPRCVLAHLPAGAPAERQLDAAAERAPRDARHRLPADLRPPASRATCAPRPLGGADEGQEPHHHARHPARGALSHRAGGAHAADGAGVPAQSSTTQTSVDPASSIDAFAPVYGAPCSSPRSPFKADQRHHAARAPCAGPDARGAVVPRAGRARGDRAHNSASPGPQAAAASIGLEQQHQDHLQRGPALPRAERPGASTSATRLSFTPLLGTIAGGDLLEARARPAVRGRPEVPPGRTWTHCSPCRSST